MLDFIAKPLGMLLKFIFDFVGNYGYSIIIFTIITKILLLPINIKQTESTKRMNEMNPKMKEIQEKYKNDKEKMNQKLMEFYKENNYNPASGCLPALIQMPILFALFYVIQNPVKFVFLDAEIYANIAKNLWWVTDLGKPEMSATMLRVAGYGVPILAILSAGTTYYQMKMISAPKPKTEKGKQDTAAQTQNMMTNIMPIMFGWITLSVPSGLALYWVAGNVFTIIQQYFMMKPKPQAEKKEEE
ncbi:MAG: YidC/Oxa1 family membrane protein insertase [Clostridiaceae bacterium]|nr:YidC/Oxa1 family membrane protein insertase [Clostridiaceae bacterium]